MYSTKTMTVMDFYKLCSIAEHMTYQDSGWWDKYECVMSTNFKDAFEKVISLFDESHDHSFSLYLAQGSTARFNGSLWSSLYNESLWFCLYDQEDEATVKTIIRPPVSENEGDEKVMKITVGFSKDELSSIYEIPHVDFVTKPGLHVSHLFDGIEAAINELTGGTRDDYKDLQDIAKLLTVITVGPWVFMEWTEFMNHLQKLSDLNRLIETTPREVVCNTVNGIRIKQTYLDALILEKSNRPEDRHDVVWIFPKENELRSLSSSGEYTELSFKKEEDISVAEALLYHLPEQHWDRILPLLENGYENITGGHTSALHDTFFNVLFHDILGITAGPWEDETDDEEDE